jgi:hypothetical protein
MRPRLLAGHPDPGAVIEPVRVLRSCCMSDFGGCIGLACPYLDPLTISRHATLGSTCSDEVEPARVSGDSQHPEKLFEFGLSYESAARISRVHGLGVGHKGQDNVVCAWETRVAHTPQLIDRRFDIAVSCSPNRICSLVHPTNLVPEVRLAVCEASSMTFKVCRDRSAFDTRFVKVVREDG